MRAVAAALGAALAVASAGATGEDRITVEASRAGFKPSVINVRKGEAVHVVLATADVEHCFAVDALRIEKRIVPGRTTEFDLTADQTGTLAFYCCLEPGDERQRGRLVVDE
jgi:heme/copper-type cytochrome/quinol oxidase subunit 2